MKRDINYSSIINTELPEKIESELVNCLKSLTLPIYDTEEVAEEFEKVWNNETFQKHLDENFEKAPVVMYKKDEQSGKLCRCSLKINPLNKDLYPGFS